MSQEYPAIYEGGVFRPLTPLSLPEQTPAKITIDAPDVQPSAPPANLRAQQQALDAMFAAVDQLPQTPSTDGLTNRDHDQILYGPPK